MLAILLFILVSFQTLGYLMLTLARLKEVRAEMTLLLEGQEESGTAQTVILTDAEFHQSRSGTREVHYRGNLYDVLKINPLPDGKIAVTLIRDEHEQDLLNHLGLCFQSGNHSRQGQPAAYSFVKLLTQTFILPAEAIFAQAFPDSSLPLEFTFSGLSSVFHPFAIAPPPRPV